MYISCTHTDSQSNDTVNHIKRQLKKGYSLVGKMGTYFQNFIDLIFEYILSSWYYIGKQETKTSTMNWWNFGQKVIQRAQGAALLHAILSSGTYCDEKILKHKNLILFLPFFSAKTCLNCLN